MARNTTPDAPTTDAPADEAKKGKTEPTVPDAPEGSGTGGGAGEHNPTVHGLLVQAQDLRKEKKAYLERVEANRSTLRMLDKTGFRSDEQAAAIAAFYPPNTRAQNQSNN